MGSEVDFKLIFQAAQKLLCLDVASSIFFYFLSRLFLLWLFLETQSNRGTNIKQII